MSHALMFAFLPAQLSVRVAQTPDEEESTISLANLRDDVVDVRLFAHNRHAAIMSSNIFNCKTVVIRENIFCEIVLIRFNAHARFLISMEDANTLYVRLAIFTAT